MSPELVEARTSTFGDMWPHEHKKGWKPKVKQMVEAGWAYDPSPADEDGATCFYCNMSLDGWEPKDSPLEEHRRREPNCLFFALMDRYKSTRRKGGRGRASTASRASRLSTQSVQSTFSEAPSLMSLGDTSPQLEVEDSIVHDTTISSDAGKGRKKAPKGKKKTSRQESIEPSIQYPTLQETSQVEDDIYAVPVDAEPVPTVEQLKPKRGRKPKNAQDSTVIDDSMAEPAPKPTRGRKKAKEPSPPRETSLDESQLQSELQDAAEVAVVARSPSTKSGRGIKRTSDGLEKPLLGEEEAIEEEPIKPKKATKPTKAKKGKKAAKDNQEEAEESAAISQPEEKPKRTRSKKTKTIEPEPEREPEVEPEPTTEQMVEVQSEVAHPAETDQHLEPEQEAFERNFEIADSDAEPDNEPHDEAQKHLQEQDIDQENVDPSAEADIDMDPENEQRHNPHEQQDEDVLEEEFNNLENVEAEEEAVVEEVGKEVDQEEEQPVSIAQTPAAEEFELTPTPEVKRISAASMSSVRRSVVQQVDSDGFEGSAHSTPRSTRSPQQSDAENQPPSSSTHAPATAQKDVPALSAVNAAIQPKEIFASPTKTTRVPLAASTPNRSPSRRSPSKFGKLTSTIPWEAVDLESIFFPDSENENGDADDVFDKLLEVGGGVTSSEKKMTVEEWIRSRAELGETKLKNECERLVMLFEKEGNRGLAALAGIQTSS